MNRRLPHRSSHHGTKRLRSPSTTIRGVGATWLRSQKARRSPSLITSLSTTLALTLGLAFTATSRAQGQVELFGQIDMGLTTLRGVESGARTSVGSGISLGSALGVRGEEALDGGYKAVFVLEHGLYADTGGVSQAEPLSGKRVPAYATRGVTDPALAAALQSNLGDYLVSELTSPFWGRQALVGLITPVGAVLAGRMYSPAYEVFDRFDPMESGNVAGPYTLLAVPVGLEVRIKRGVQYRIEAGDWSGALMWAGANPSGADACGHFWGMNLGYETDTVSVGLGHQRRNNTRGETALVNTSVGAWWRWQDWRLMGSYTRALDRHPESGVLLQNTVNEQFGGAVPAPVQAAAAEVASQLQVDSKVVSLGVQYQLSPKWRLIGNHARLQDNKLAQGDASLWGAAAQYSLSKRTSVWTAWSRIRNQAEQQIAPMTSGSILGFANVPGQDTSALQLNFSHRF